MPQIACKCEIRSYRPVVAVAMGTDILAVSAGTDILAVCVDRGCGMMVWHGVCCVSGMETMAELKEAIGMCLTCAKIMGGKEGCKISRKLVYLAMVMVWFSVAWVWNLVWHSVCCIFGETKKTINMRKRRERKERLELFGGYYAESEGDLFVVRENGVMRSPHYYSALEPLTPSCWALMRAEDGRIDLLFSDKSWIMGVWEAYELARWGGKNGISVLSLHTDDGTDIIDDWGRHILSFDGYRHIGILDDRFIVVYDPNPPGPYVYVYNLTGELVTEGYLRQAEKEALKWRPERRG